MAMNVLTEIPMDAFRIYPANIPPEGALCLTYDLVKGMMVYKICRFVYDKAGCPAFVDPVLPNLPRIYPNAWVQLKER